MPTLGLIAGKGAYPQLVIEGARAAGIKKIVLAAFEEETAPNLTEQADAVSWFQVGQLGKMIYFLKKQAVSHTMMAGQITPRRLFDLRPDLKALMLLAKLRKRNAETIFGAIADELEKEGMPLLPATQYVEKHLAPLGAIAGPQPGRQVLRDIDFGWPIAKQISALDIGQSVVVRQGTVLAVEGLDGTDSTIRRGGGLGRGKAVVLKVSKPHQDFRFDVPVIGTQTLEVAAEAGIVAIVCEAKKTLLLERMQLTEIAERKGISLWGYL